MLRNLNSLVGLSLLARDGEIGHVCDALFDDRTWVVRYLVAATGEWLLGRTVLISPAVADSRGIDDRAIHVDLTRDQVRTSPDIDTDRPVSRRQEIEMMAHYGWSPYWMPEAAYPVAMPETAEISVPQGNPDLRSAKEILRYTVTTSDGELGRLGDLVIEDANWFIRFLVVNTGHWFSGHKLLVSTRWAGSISWPGQAIHLPHGRDEL